MAKSKLSFTISTSSSQNAVLNKQKNTFSFTNISCKARLVLYFLLVAALQFYFYLACCFSYDILCNSERFYWSLVTLNLYSSSVFMVLYFVAWIHPSIHISWYATKRPGLHTQFWPLMNKRNYRFNMHYWPQKCNLKVSEFNALVFGLPW